jgi:hypothetical protein
LTWIATSHRRNVDKAFIVEHVWADAEPRAQAIPRRVSKWAPALKNARLEPD